MKWDLDARAAGLSPTVPLTTEELARRWERLETLQEQGALLNRRYGYCARRKHKREIRRMYRGIRRQVAEIRTYLEIEQRWP